LQEREKTAGERRIDPLRGLLMAICATLAVHAGAEELAYEVALQQSDAGTYYVPGRLGFGIETEFLVDTGSSYVVLSRDTFRSLKAHTSPVRLRDIQGAMASGRALRVPVYRLDMLAIGDRCVLRDVEVAVVPGATRDILGLSALRHMAPVLVGLDPPRLRFARCAAGPPLQTSAQS
jgi:predicted aspartyl protease